MPYLQNYSTNTNKIWHWRLKENVKTQQVVVLFGSLQTLLSWDMAPCSLAEFYRLFVGSYSVHHDVPRVIKHRA
jgi:hypothetical protein